MKGKQVADFNQAYIALTRECDFVWIDNGSSFHVIVKDRSLCQELKQRFRGVFERVYPTDWTFKYVLSGAEAPPCYTLEQSWEDLHDMLLCTALPIEFLGDVRRPANSH